MNKTLSKYIIIAFAGIVVFFAMVKLIEASVDKHISAGEFVFTAIVEKDDVFQLFYWQEGEKKFKIANSVRTKVVGSDKFQEIKFKLPELKSLYRLRLDIGENTNQKNVIIQSFKFLSEKGDNDFNVKEFNQLFSPNKYIKVHSQSSFAGELGGKGKSSFYDPYFVSNDNSSQIRKIRGESSEVFAYLAGLLTSVILMMYLSRIQGSIVISVESVFATLFVLLLIVPIFQEKFEIFDKLKSLEKRKLAEKPEFDLTNQFSKSFEAYLDDNFGFRNRLVSWGSTYKTKIFRSTKNPDLSMFGKDKWLFYTRRIGNSRMYESYTRTNLLSEDTLGLLINEWKRRRLKCEVENRKYFSVFWPNKHTIYPEKMSWGMKTQIMDTVSRVDQILNYINKTGSSEKLIDVRSSLLEEKKTKQLYYKFDSHWNDYGGYVGYESFFNQTFNELGISPKKLEYFEIQWNKYYGGELIELSGIRNDGYFEDIRPVFKLKENKNQIQYLPIDGYPRLTVITKNEHADNKLRVLVFRDSYTNSLIQFFSLHFHEVYYIWGHKESFIDKLNPDIVIDGFVERAIGNGIK